MIKCTRPNGYFGDKVEVELSIKDGRIIERHAHGYHTCPAVSAAHDTAGLEWLLDHHQNFMIRLINISLELRSL